MSRTAGKKKSRQQVWEQESLRWTRGRDDILAVLRAAKRPLGQEEVAGRLRGRRLNKTTIYRALEEFERIGLVHRVLVKDQISYFELANHCQERQCHAHFVCTSCGGVDCWHGIFAEIKGEIPSGYVIGRQQLRIEGLCPACG